MDVSLSIPEAYSVQRWGKKANSNAVWIKIIYGEVIGYGENLGCLVYMGLRLDKCINVYKLTR